MHLSKHELFDGHRSLAKKGSGKWRGKQLGSAGHDHSQKLAITARCGHRPEICAACAAALSVDAVSKACTAWDEVDMASPVEGLIALTSSVRGHKLREVGRCCGDVSRAQAWRAPADGQWKTVELWEWASRGSPAGRGDRAARAAHASVAGKDSRISEGTVRVDAEYRRHRRNHPGSGRCRSAAGGRPGGRHRSGSATAVDETSWPESGTLLWLWAAVTTHRVLLLVGPRRREMLENALQDGFSGPLISDGYGRAWASRLRRRLHLRRKLGGLAESSDARVSGVGQEMEGIMKTLMAAIYAARINPPPEGLPARYANAIGRLQKLCEAHRMDDHSVLPSIGREFLYEWKVILRPVAEPRLPLSNNAAKQVLRHWAISRAIRDGTRSEEGSRPPRSSAASSKRFAAAENSPGSISAPSSPPPATACCSPPSSPSRQPCREAHDYPCSGLAISTSTDNAISAMPTAVCVNHTIKYRSTMSSALRTTFMVRDPI